MKSLKWKIIIPLIFASILFVAKLILFDYVVSTGKRVGNLTKLSKKGKVFKTWEGTIDEGSGDKLTSYFSISDDKIAEELYAFEGRQVVIYYKEHVIGWPRDTKYNVVSWKPNEENKVKVEEVDTISDELKDMVENTKFCMLLGAIYTDKELYLSVKKLVKSNNLFIYNQIAKCNEL